MRTIGTWALVGAVCVLGLAALVDAFVGDGENAPETTARRPPTVSTDTNAELTETLRRLGVRGTITYADTRCGLHVLGLPELDNAEAGGSPSCEFSVSPGGTWSPEGMLDPQGRSAARCLRAGVVELQQADDGTLQIGPGCSPAWTPDGRLTSVWRGGLYRLVERRQGGRALDPVPLITRAALARQLADTSWGRRSPFVREAAWLTDDLVAVIVASGVDAGRDGLALFRDGEIVAPPLGPYTILAHVRPSPRGTYVSAVIADGTGLVVADAGGELVGVPVRTGQAIAWSPDELYGLIASPGGTTLFAPPTAGHAVTQVLRLPIVARDLVWN